MKSDRKPPLAKSPMRLRTHRAVQPNNINTPLRTPIGSLTKTRIKESVKTPVCHTISCELSALTKMVQDELAAFKKNAVGFGNYSSIGNNNVESVYERGRFYDEYSARRNERLKKKQSERRGDDEPKTTYRLGVKVDSNMKKDSKKKVESLKKSSMAATYSVDRSQHPRYALRSTAKKPPLPVVPMNVEEKAVRKTAVSRAKRNV